MLRYIGSGNFVFDKESGEQIILSERDLIELRLDMGKGSKDNNSAIASAMEQSRLERPINPNARKRAKRGRK